MLVLIQHLCSLHAKAWNSNARHCCDNFVKPINIKLLKLFGLTFQWWQNFKSKSILIGFLIYKRKCIMITWFNVVFIDENMEL